MNGGRAGATGRYIDGLGFAGPCWLRGGGGLEQTKWRRAAQKESSALGQGRRRHGGKIDECTGLVPAPVRLDWSQLKERKAEVSIAPFRAVKRRAAMV